MNGVTIEEATPCEAKQILDIQKQAYLSEAIIYNDFQIPPLTQSLAEIKSDFESHRFYVAKVHKIIVGMVKINIDGNRGYIGRLAVLPEMQKKGIGTLLMDHIESHHIDLDTLELFTGHKSEQNLSFYSKRGYETFKHQAVNDNLSFVFLQKKVADKDTI
jgi:N-acetylglutamate synthase-like GNAT family acetyltransferase